MQYGSNKMTFLVSCQNALYFNRNVLPSFIAEIIVGKKSFDGAYSNSIRS